ncbi:hypothetical protein [Nocardia sp. NPDC056000]|uniref:hypothetical protein n=1 Tax=Nocardia sp. NPDC056000 TaxID=3345674 RepID=UPI0035D56E49
MRIKRFTATAVLAIGVTVFTATGVAGADPSVEGPNPDVGQSISIPVEDAPPPAAGTVDDPDVTMHQCNAILGALTGGLIGGTFSALPGALIGAGIGALIGWSLLYPPGPPLACWQPPAPN